MNIGKCRIVVWLLAGLLTACSSRTVDTEVTRCTYPDSPRTPAPSFLCQASISGFPITVLRSSEPGDLPVSERIEIVFADQIQQWAKAWSLEWFEHSDDQMTAELSLVQRLTDQARVVRSRVSPNGYLWLLVAVPLTVDELRSQTIHDVSDGGSD